MSEMTTVLIVDDEPIVRDVVVRYLQRDGFDTIEAGDGDAARSIIQSGAADLVVLDVMLPGTDGLALCRWIRTDSALPVIMLTARGEAADRIVGLELGADDYVTKPFSPRELAIRVRNVLKRAESPPQTAAKTITFDELTIDGAAREVTLSGAPVRLTGKEFDLLFFLASQPARGVLPEAVDGSCLGVRSCSRHGHGDGAHPPVALEDRARSVSPSASRDALGRRLQVRSVIHLAIVVALSTLAVGLLGAVALRRLSAVRAQLAAFGLLAVLLPLAAVLLSGWVMFHMGADVKILAVAAAAAASAVAVALVLAASITRPLEQLSASADRLAQGDLTVRAPTGGPRELARLGSSFNAMAAELESLFDARRELIAAASHDLRTPVASITAMLEAIEDGLAQPEEYLAPLQEHARRLASLVDDLFELARIDAGALSHELQIVAVAPLVDSCVRGVEAVARARGVTLGPTARRSATRPLRARPGRTRSPEPAHQRPPTHPLRRRDRRQARRRRRSRNRQRRGHRQRPHRRGGPPHVRPLLAQRPGPKRRNRPRPRDRPRSRRSPRRPHLGGRSRNRRSPRLLHAASRITRRLEHPLVSLSSDTSSAHDLCDSVRHRMALMNTSHFDDQAIDAELALDDYKSSLRTGLRVSSPKHL